METENGNTAVTTATSKTGSEGKKRMEFRRIKIKDLVVICKKWSFCAKQRLHFL